MVVSCRLLRHHKYFLTNRRFLAIDTETTGLYLRHGCKPFYVSTCDSQGKVRVWEWDVDPLTRQPIIPEDELEELRRYIAEFKTLVFHNAQFDLEALASIGIEIDPEDTVDTLIISHAHKSDGRHGLKSLAYYYTNYPDRDETALKKAVNDARRYARKHFPQWRIASPDCPELRPASHSRKTDEDVSVWTYSDYWLPRAVALAAKTPEGQPVFPEGHEWYTILDLYGRGDAERTVALIRYYSWWFDDLPSEEKDRIYNSVDRNHKAQAVVYRRLRKAGVGFHTERAKKILDECLAEAQKFEKEARKISKIQNLRSDKQIATFYYSKTGGCGLTPTRLTKGGNPSVDKDSIYDIVQDQPEDSKATVFSKLLLSMRLYDKAAESLESLLRAEINERLYPHIHICGTGTTRVASSDPNGQNIAKRDDPFLFDIIGIKKPKLRNAFGPRRGQLWFGCDYVQLQYVIAAQISGETAMIEALASGYDAHTLTAKMIFDLTDDPDPDQRRIAKNVNFGILFGATEGRIELTAKRPGLYSIIRERIPNICRAIDDSQSYARKHKKVYTEGGYPLVCPQPHKAFNYRVQGTEGEIVKEAMIRVDRVLTDYEPAFRRRGLEPMNLILQIHDELVFEGPDHSLSYKAIRKCLEAMDEAARAFGIPANASCEVCRDNWAQGLELKRSSNGKKKR